MRHRLLAAAMAAALTATGLTAVLLPERAAPVQTSADASPGARDVIVHLFEWPWASVASECTNVLGPKGFGAVQVSPPQEHVVLPGQGYPWWQDYQPVSYRLNSRRGNRAAFASMVSTCHAAGVKIYVDAVINHMAGGASTGPGSDGSTYSQYSYPSVPYGYSDFHHCGRHGNDDIQAWNDRWEVQNCELVDLSDLATESSYVRGKITAYLNDLVGLGVDGFRIDAAKHMPTSDLSAIYNAVNNTTSGARPYVYQEVIEGGAGEISPSEYVGIGDVTEFRSGDAIGNAFRDGNLANLANLHSSMLLASGDAVAFVDNHDTQRNGRARLTYKDGVNYTLAEAFLLAYNYGTPQVMSSFTFTGNDQGPPATNGTTNAVTCGAGWQCEHRATANLVAFHNTVAGTPVTNWWTNGGNQIAFGRGSAGYAVFNRGGALTRTFQSSLPAGNYCDVASSDNCTGTPIAVNSAGQFTATIPPNGMLALHINARSGGPTSPPACTSVAATFSVNATTTSGQSVHVVGSIPALGNWNTGSAVALTQSGSTWTGTVALPFNTSFEYKYIKKNASGAVTWESDPNRTHATTTACTASWSEVWNQQGGSSCTSIAAAFGVNATTFWGQNVFVVGSIAALGNWNTGSAVALSSANYPVWTATVNLPPGTAFQYKYIKKDGSGNVVWESDPNRSRTTPTAAPCTASYSDSWR